MAEDIARLPKWAQSKIENLERQVVELQGLVDETRNSQADSNVKVSRFGPCMPDYDADWGLPKNAEIDFYLEKGNRIEVRHQRTEPGWLHISANRGAVLVKPCASNVVEIGVEDW